MKVDTIAHLSYRADNGSICESFLDSYYRNNYIQRKFSEHLIVVYYNHIFGLIQEQAVYERDRVRREY